jgi:hypothetical protein
VNKHERQIKGLTAEEGDVDGYIDKNPTAELVKEGNDAERDVSKLRKQRRQLVKDNAPAGDVKEIEAEITERMKEFNELVKEARRSR